MANRNVIKNNLRSVTQTISGFDQGNKTRDDLLKTYNKSIKQIPDYYNKQLDNRHIFPTSIASASRDLRKAVQKRDPKLLKMDPKKYMEKLNQEHKYGLWVLFDYDNYEPVDSNPKKCREIMINYQAGLQHELELARQHEHDNEIEM